jgi:6-pyruvoyltetrahydropterin/6-carboxytetrahydropterin synthase
MTVMISKDFKFEAAHELPYHQGQCRDLHGHSYTGTVVIEGPIRGIRADDPQSGMVADFAIISEVIKLLDHKYLNGFMEYPTAERIAKLILEMIQGRLPEGATVVHVRLKETESSEVVVTG